MSQNFINSVGHISYVCHCLRGLLNGTGPASEWKTQVCRWVNLSVVDTR